MRASEFESAAAVKQRREDPKSKCRGKAKNVAAGVREQGVAEEWSQKYKNSINCSHPKGFSQKAHCAGKKKHNESIEMESVCPDCGMCEVHAEHENLDEACWKGYHKEGNKKMFGKTYPNCVKNEGVAEGSFDSQHYFDANKDSKVRKDAEVDQSQHKQDWGRDPLDDLTYLAFTGAKKVKNMFSKNQSKLNEYRSSYSNSQIDLKKFKPGARVSHPLLGPNLGTIVDTTSIPIKDRRNTGVPVKPDNTNKIYWMNPGSLEILPENTRSKHNKQGVAEGKIKLYTDPDYYGAEVDDEGFDSLPIVNIPINRLVGFEPDAKMQQPDAKKNVKKILAGLEAGDSIAPILVRKYENGYQVLDGHHRFHAYKIAKKNTVPARVVDPKDIEEIDKQGVAENFADGKGPGRPGDSQRHGIPKGATIAQLEKAAKAPGRKGQLARWQINMRRGKK
jgi:hypothetical protein